MYTRMGTLNVSVCAPRVIPTPGETYPTVAGNRFPAVPPPIRSRRGVPYASAPRFIDKPSADDANVVTPVFASHVSGTPHGTATVGERMTFVVCFGFNV